jgi:heme/copper-type cytochrome/quinol oxidase subunit 1
VGAGDIRKSSEAWQENSMASIAQPQTTVARPTTKSNTGLWSWITTVDHKRLGIMYGVSAFFFFLVGGLEALIIRAQLIRPDNDLVAENTYNELFTMHGTTMIFLAIMPLSVAFFNYIMPLQIGARDVAFPRLNAFSFWVFIFGAILLNVSWLVGNAPAIGWYGYAPLTNATWNPTRSVDFWMLGLQVLGVASLAGAFNFIVTVLNMRAPGMTLMRMPIFTWTTLIVSFLMIMAFPAITVALFLLGMDRFAGTGFFAPAAGGDPLLWQHLFWIFGHPEVYILILPAFGIISEIIPTFSRKPLFGYAVMVYATAAIGFLGFGVWVHHMFTTGLGPTANSVFAATTMIIAVPTGVKIFNWIGTMVLGQIRFTTPMLFAVGLVSQFTIGGLSGVMHASPPIDTHHNDSYFVIAHFHYVLFGGSIFGLLAGIYYWFPKFTGRMMDDRIGKINFWMVSSASTRPSSPCTSWGSRACRGGTTATVKAVAGGSGMWSSRAVRSCLPPGSWSFSITWRFPSSAAGLPGQTRGMRRLLSGRPHRRRLSTTSTRYPPSSTADPLWAAKYGIDEEEHDLNSPSVARMWVTWMPGWTKRTRTRPSTTPWVRKTPRTRGCSSTSIRRLMPTCICPTRPTIRWWPPLA